MSTNRVSVAFRLARRQGVGSTARYYFLKALNQCAMLPSIVKVKPRRFMHAVELRTGSSSDLDVFRAVALGEEYDFLDSLGDVRTVIDLGANIGLASAVILSRFPKSLLLAVEPEPANCAQLRKNLAPYAERAQVLEGAVWPSAGQVSLDYAAGDGREWATAVKDGCGVRAYSVQELLSHFRGRPIDLLKIDIEGSEKALFSANTSWLANVHNLCIELHDRECAAAFRHGMRDYVWNESLYGEYVVCEGIRR